MKMNKILTGLMMAVFLAAAGYAFAGSLDSPGEVSATASRMHTMEDVYDYLTDVDNPPPGIRTGVADSATSTTLVDADLKPYADDYYNTWTIEITAGTGSGQSRTVSDFVSATGTITVSSGWTTNPDSTSSYKISPTGFAEPATEFTAGTMHTLDNIFENLIRFPASGQTSTFATADDGDLEKGATLCYQDNADGTVTDLNTGLMWELKTDDSGIHDKDNTYTWSEAFSVFIAGVNSAEFAGYTDWRLPNIKELQSIVNYGNWTPAFGEATVGGVGTGAPFINIVSEYYWSSTTYAYEIDEAWSVRCSNGYVNHFGLTDNFYVRCVRGGQ